ncbi:CdaR family protein [Cohnella pontilimi]|uniref:CdaR family protein n=1 Tax=Cohnella pontilimi TaxID=2564100 RepID=UPI00145F3F65|nr:CdaR family protein [Cohnella pontilimi]
MDKWLNHPTAIKIMALTIGIIMWAVVHFDPGNSPNNVASLTETKTINNVKVEPVGLDERSYKLVSIEPGTVNLLAKGSRSDLMAARKSNDYRLLVDLRGLGEGTHTLSLRVDSSPSGVQVVEMNPGSVRVTIESLQTKEFEVAIRTEGTAADGFIAGTPIVRPTNRVHVTLPKNTLAKVESVGAVIPLKGTTEAIKSKAVKLAAYDAQGRVIQEASIDPAVVEVEVPITSPFKMVPVRFRMLGEMPAGLSIATFKPDMEQVTVYAAKEALDKIDFVEADVQLGQLSKSGKITLPLLTTEPVIEISPAQAVVNVEVVLSQTRTLEGLPIGWKGLGSGLTAKITNPETGKADITLKGAPALLNRLEPGDVQVIADFSGKGPGTHTLPLVVNMPRFIEQSGGTKTITVEITAAPASPASAGSPDSGGAESNSPTDSLGSKE